MLQEQATFSGDTSGQKRKDKYDRQRDELIKIVLAPAAALGAVGASSGKPELEADALVLLTHLPAVCDHLEDLARQKPAVYAWLAKAMEQGIYGVLIVDVLTIAFAIASNHGILKVPEQLASVLGAR